MLTLIGAAVVWITTEVAIKPLGRYCDQLSVQVLELTVKAKEEEANRQQAEERLHRLNLARAAAGDRPHTATSYIQSMKAADRRKIERGIAVDDPVLDLLMKKGAKTK